VETMGIREMSIVKEKQVRMLFWCSGNYGGIMVVDDK
jgi:hypothetical protein